MCPLADGVNGTNTIGQRDYGFGQFIGETSSRFESSALLVHGGEQRTQPQPRLLADRVVLKLQRRPRWLLKEDQRSCSGGSSTGVKIGMVGPTSL